METQTNIPHGRTAMKNDAKTRDAIDNELAKIYFNPAGTSKAHPGGQRKKISSHSARRRSAAVIAVLLSSVLAFLLAMHIMATLGIRPFASAPGTGHGRLHSLHTTPLPVLLNETVLYDFESGREGWGIPSWAMEEADYRQTAIDISQDIASGGSKSLRMDIDLPPGTWSAALAEIEHFLDLTDQGAMAIDVYVPPVAPRGLRAKLILTVGEDWKFVEMSRSVRLVPGEWVGILASLEPDSIDWKWTRVDDTFKSDIRKISLRIEYEGRQGYAGPVYIDSFRVGDMPE